MSTPDVPINRGKATPVPPRGGKKARPGARPAPARPAAKRAPAKGGPAAWQARRRRRRMTGAISAVAIVVVVVGVLIGIKVSDNSSASTKLVAGVAPVAAPASVVSQVTGLPVSTMAQASGGATTIQGLTVLKGQKALTSGGKPEILYIGAEFCPYCAAERWALVAALSKFGTFTNLGQTHSASGDIYANSPTFSFYGSTYTSKYLTFTPVETTTNQLNSSQTGYDPLQNPTAAQATLWKSLDPQQDIPFIDIGGKYQVSTSGYVPGVLSNKTMQYVAAQVGNNSTTVGKDIDQTAGVLTKDICSLTGDQPSAVCSAFTAKA